MPKNWCATQIENNKSEYKISPANLNRYAVFWFAGTVWEYIVCYGDNIWYKGASTQTRNYSLFVLCVVLFKEKKNK